MNFFHDPTRNLSVYETQSDILRKAIPEAKLVALPAINGSPAFGGLAVPHTLRNAQVLRHFGYPVAPIITDATYNWPRVPGLTPYASQKIAANFMVTHARCFNLSDMGVGKTLAALWAADWLMRQHAPGTFRCLIVCPLSIMQRVWSDAIFKNFLGARTFEILHGPAEKRLASLDRSADFYIVNFDGVGVGAHTRKRFELDGFSKALESRSDIRLSIVDEASAYKDATTKRHRIAREVIGKRQYVWLMTGTPTPNAPTDAYGLAKMVNNAWGKSFNTFRSETMFNLGASTGRASFIWKPRPDGYDKARALLSPAIRFDIKEVWDAPPTTTQQREIELTADQKRHLHELKKDLMVLVKSGATIDVPNEAAARSKLLQISMGAIYDKNHKVHLIDSSPRLRECEAVIESTQRKVVIFVGLTSVLNLLYKTLSKRWGCVVLNGAVTPKDRAINISRFADDDAIRIMIADPQTTAHGINEFVVADIALWYGPCEKNELYMQGNKRVSRPGQKHPNSIIQLVATPTEREIYRRLETNGSMQGLLLDMIRTLQ